MIIKDKQNQRFPDEYIHDISESQSVINNYFLPVWDRVFLKVEYINKLLDIGCGTGVFSLAAHLITKCELYGVDGSSLALESAKKSGFNEALHVEDFDKSPLPYADGVFDFCLCKDVLEHLVDPLWILSEAHRVLTENGFLLLHVPNQFSLFSRVKFLFTNNIDTKNYFPHSQQWNYPHVRFFTHEGIKELIYTANFNIIADYSGVFSTIPYGKYLIPNQYARENIVAKFPSQLSEGFTFLIQKK